MGDTKDLVNVKRVENKSKWIKLNLYTPSNLIKITHEHNCSHLRDSDNSRDSNSFSKSDDFSKSDKFSKSNEFSDSDEFSKCDKFSENENFSKQQHNTPHEDDAPPGFTAVAAVMMAESIKSRSSKKVPTKKIIRVQLDSGSDEDLLFHKKGAAKQLP